MAQLTRTTEIKGWYRWYLKNRMFSSFSMYVVEEDSGEGSVTMACDNQTLKVTFASYEAAAELFQRGSKRVGFPLGLYPLGYKKD